MNESTHPEIIVVGRAQSERVELEVDRDEGDAALPHEIKLRAPD